MFDETGKYENWGHFFFSAGTQLKEVSKDVPNKPGVYYFLRLARGAVDLVYIGKSGTMLQNWRESVQKSVSLFFHVNGIIK